MLDGLSCPGIRNGIAGAQSIKVLVKIGNFLPFTTDPALLCQMLSFLGKLFLFERVCSMGYFNPKNRGKNSCAYLIHPY
jgi:hypothetical protein